MGVWLTQWVLGSAESTAQVPQAGMVPRGAGELGGLLLSSPLGVEGSRGEDESR